MFHCAYYGKSIVKYFCMFCDHSCAKMQHDAKLSVFANFQPFFLPIAKISQVAKIAMPD